MDFNEKTLAVIDLAYVGLPLVVEFGKSRPLIGFDIKPERVAELRSGKGHTLECNRAELTAKVVDIVRALCGYAQVDVYEPWIDIAEGEHEYGLCSLHRRPALGARAAVILAVGRRQFVERGESGMKAYAMPGAVVYDVKSILPLGATDGRF